MTAAEMHSSQERENKSEPVSFAVWEISALGRFRCEGGNQAYVGKGEKREYPTPVAKKSALTLIQYFIYHCSPPPPPRPLQAVINLAK